MFWRGVIVVFGGIVFLMRGQLHQSFFFYVCFLFYCRSELPISKIVPPKTQQQQQLNNKSIPLPYISFSFNFLTFRQKTLGQLSQQLTSITRGLCPYFLPHIESLIWNILNFGGEKRHGSDKTLSTVFLKRQHSTQLEAVRRSGMKWWTLRHYRAGTQQC